MLDDLIFRVANAIFIRRNKSLVEAYQQMHGRLPDIANPKHYTERMLWRKIVDRNPQFVLFSDKLATKDYVQRLCPDLAVPAHRSGLEAMRMRFPPIFYVAMFM